jgi:hypothetical protein
MNKWISVNDKLPEIPEGYFAIDVIVAVYDGSGDNDPDHGNSISCTKYFREGCTKHFAEVGWMELQHGEHGASWVPSYDKVTHWMYMPSKPVREHVYYDGAGRRYRKIEALTCSDCDISDRTDCRVLCPSWVRENVAFKLLTGGDE